MPHHRAATRRFLATVLFTDIVGSTQRAVELGDQAWRDLLERHNTVVRRQLKAFGGREMDTAGDGFFAVFETPERAVRCAESVIAALAPLSIQVRAGVHTGECQLIAGKVGGMAVTIGARIAGHAQAGQVLVSGSTRDLMTGSGARFVGGDLRELKGVADAWRVYRLVPELVSGEVPAQRNASMVPLYHRKKRRRTITAVAAVLAMVLAGSIGYLLTRPARDVAVGENAVGLIGSGAPRVSAAVAVGQRPAAVAAGFGSVWVANSAENTVSRISLRSHDSVQIPVGADPAGIAVGEGAVWVANSGNSTVWRLDPATSKGDPIRVRPGPTGIVVAFGSVWVTNALDAAVTQIDPDTDHVEKVISVGANPTGIAAGAGYLWVTNQGDGTVSRFNPRTYAVDTPINVGRGPVGIAFDDGAMWVANNLDGSLSRIGVRDLTVTGRTLVPNGGAYGVAAHGGNVWVSNEYAGTLVRVTARTFTRGATVRLIGAPLGVAFAGDDLWFTSAGGGSGLHRGGSLTMVGLRLAFHFPHEAPASDFTLHYTDVYSQLAALTNDGLVGFRRAGGVQGAFVVPDLAESLPAPTPDGLTYTFHLRPGIRYSTGAPVLAGDIRRGIERAVAHNDNLDNTAPYFVSELSGAQACADASAAAIAAKRARPDCRLSGSIVADDKERTITFHLIRPTPEFLYQLALYNASAVPQNTPIDLPPGTFLPSTGPYKIASYVAEKVDANDRPIRKGRLELVRNPYFHVWSTAAQPAGYPDRIVLKTGYTERQAVVQVTSGRADLVWRGAFSERSAQQLPPRYLPQLHTAPGIFEDYVYLNATRPPFNKRDARRAVAYALDRRKLDAVAGMGHVSCQLIPPNFPGYQPHCPFTGGVHDGKWHSQDVARARTLVRRSGTLGDRVVIEVADHPHFRNGGKLIARTLSDLGYHASLRLSSTFAYVRGDLGRGYNVGIGNYGADYPAASTYVATLASCAPDRYQTNLAGYCDPKIETKISSAFKEQVTDLARANAAWAAIDRDVVDAAAIIPYTRNVTNDFVSRRVGNVLQHPAIGALLDQMWVQ